MFMQKQNIRSKQQGSRRYVVIFKIKTPLLNNNKFQLYLPTNITSLFEDIVDSSKYNCLFSPFLAKILNGYNLRILF